MLGMKYDRNGWKKTFVARIQEYDKRWWMNGFGINGQMRLPSGKRL